MLYPVLDVLATPILIHDLNGRLVYANAAARLARVRSAEIEELVRCARAEPGVAFVTVSGSDQLCSIAAGDEIVTLIARPHDCCNADVAATLFGLTPTQRRVVSLLGAGNSAPDIAKLFDSSLHTIHSHLKSIFAKTRTRSQNELIAVVRGGIALFGSPAIRGCANNRASLDWRFQVQQEKKERGS